MENGKLFYHAHPNPKFFVVVFLYQPVYPICLSIAFLSHIVVEHFSTNFSQNLSQKLFFDVFKIFSKPFKNLSKPFPFQNLFEDSKTFSKPFQPLPKPFQNLPKNFQNLFLFDYKNTMITKNDLLNKI